MAKTPPGPITGGAATLARTVTVADTPPLLDSNCDPTAACTTQGWRRVRVFPRFFGGASPSVTVQVLHRMTSVAGNGWVPGVQATLVDGQLLEVEVLGRDVFFAVSAITGAPTGVGIYCAGWEPVHLQGGPYR